MLTQTNGVIDGLNMSASCPLWRHALELPLCLMLSGRLAASTAEPAAAAWSMSCSSALAGMT